MPSAMWNGDATYRRFGPGSAPNAFRTSDGVLHMDALTSDATDEIHLNRSPHGTRVAIDRVDDGSPYREWIATETHSHRFRGLDEGQYVLRVAALDAQGMRSSWSEPITFAIGGRFFDGIMPPASDEEPVKAHSPSEPHATGNSRFPMGVTFCIISRSSSDNELIGPWRKLQMRTYRQ